MADKENSEQEVVDPCGEFGPVQYRALVWFVAVVFIGIGITVSASRLDRWMYDHDGEFVENYADYSDNRTAFTSLASERVDPRAHADLKSIAGEPNSD